MNVLLVERRTDSNQYLDELSKAYQAIGISVIFDVQNFLYSDFLPDFIHIQWPEAIYRWRQELPKNEETLALLKKRLSYYAEHKIPIVYTAHNMLPHINVDNFDRAAYDLIIRSADIIVHHGGASVALLKKSFSSCDQTNHIICPHGPYPYQYSDPASARTAYGLCESQYVFLNFGRQRAYKSPGFIKDVFRELNQKDGLLFTIGPGSPLDNSIGARYKSSFVHAGFKKIVRNILRVDPLEKTKTILRKFKTEEIPQILAASDCMFLGHSAGLNSGLLALAVSYGKPVIFPDIGNFKDQLQNWKWSESYTAGDIDSARNALKRMLDRIAEYRPGNVFFDNKLWLDTHSWSKHVDTIVAAVLNQKKKCSAE